MTKDIPEENVDKPSNDLKKKPSNFTAKLNRDTQDAIIRQLYIPKVLRDKIKKPDDERGR